MNTPESTSSRKTKWTDQIPVPVLAGFSLVALAAVIVGVVILALVGGNAQQTADSSQQALNTANSKVATGQELAGENLEACMDPEVVKALIAGGHQRVCDLAIVVQTQEGTPGKPGEPGPGPTQEQINAAVDAWFRTHPLPEGKSPTAEQVVTAVGEYLRANPPAPGRPPTPDEIAVATANYIALHKEDFQGPEGKRGPGPSAQDVRAGVEAYCTSADPSPCRGPAGAQGPQGIGVTGTILKRDEQGTCTLYFNHENPANGEVRQSSVQVNDELCPPQGNSTTAETPGLQVPGIGEGG